MRRFFGWFFDTDGAHEGNPPWALAFLVGSIFVILGGVVSTFAVFYGATIALISILSVVAFFGLLAAFTLVRLLAAGRIGVGEVWDRPGQAVRCKTCGKASPIRG